MAWLERHGSGAGFRQLGLGRGSHKLWLSWGRADDDGGFVVLAVRCSRLGSWRARYSNGDRLFRVDVRVALLNREAGLYVPIFPRAFLGGQPVAASL